MFDDTPRMKADITGVQMFLDGNMPTYRYDTMSDDGTIALVRSEDGSMMKSIPSNIITNWLVQKAERESNEAGLDGHLNQQLKDLQSVGVTSAMIDSGVLDDKFVDSLRRNGYQVNDIVRDFKRQHQLRTVSPTKASGLPSMR